MQNGKETPRFIEPEEVRIRWLKSFDSKAGRYFPSGFKAQDQTVGALLRGTLTVICARPGIGKTALLFALAYRQALAGVRTYFYNLEMPVEQMWNRMACLHDESLTLKELNEEEVSDEKKAKLAHLSTELAPFSPRFFESPEAREIFATAQSAIEPSSQSVLFLDYIGLMTDRTIGPDRYKVVTESARCLSELARRLNIPVVAAQQFNQAIEGRSDKIPNLSDLADSAEISKTASMVLALTREEDDILNVFCMKNRNGPMRVSYGLRFDGPRVAVEDWK
jgi:replicative DNA helicase